MPKGGSCVAFFYEVYILKIPQRLEFLQFSITIQTTHTNTKLTLNYNYKLFNLFEFLADMYLLNLNNAINLYL